MTPRRLLMTTDAVGGVWRYALDLAAGLRPLGVETVLLGFGPRPDAAQAAEARRAAQLMWADLPLDWTARDARELGAVPDAVARFVHESGADVVQVNLPSQAAGLRLNIPVVAAAHSCVASWFRVVRNSGLPEHWRWQRELTLDGFRSADAVAAPSRAFARTLAECYPGVGRIHVVPNATSLHREGNSKEPYVYSAGRWWDEGKNAAVLDAAAELARWPLYAAGATVGPDGQRVQFRHARHLGQLDRDEIGDLAASAAAFVSPSRYEPFGLAALEAARVGAALVLADIPTYREIWDGAALFADPDDPAAFAHALGLLEDADLRASYAAQASARAAGLSVEVQARRMLDLYASQTLTFETAGAS